MSGTAVSYRFSWEPASWTQSIKALFRTPPPVPTWFAELEKFNMTSMTRIREKGSPRMLPNEVDQPIESSCTVFHQSIAYLAKYSNAQLESILVKKFEQIPSPEGLKNVFHSILLLSLRTNRPKMLEVCQKVLSSKKLARLFKVPDVMKLAQKEAIVVPKPQHRVASISKSLVQALQQPLLKIRQIVRYAFSTTSQAYGVDFNTPPSNSQRAQGQWSFYRDTLHDIIVITPLIKTFFTVQWKTSLATSALLAVSVAAAYQLSEDPAPPISQAKIPEFPLLLRVTDDVQQCHTPQGFPPKREPSAELESHVQVLERQLARLNEEMEMINRTCNLERDSIPGWIDSPKGEHLFKEIDRVEKEFADYQTKLMEARKLSLRLEKLTQIRSDYRQKEHTVIHFLNEQSKKTNKSLEESQKDYLFLKYLALPEIRREYETIIAKCNILMTTPRPGSRALVKASSTSSLGASLRPSISAPPTNTANAMPVGSKCGLPLGQ
jgi:hypothetical protein